MAEQDQNEATETADLYHRHGEPNTEGHVASEAVTGRAADKPPVNSTFAERAKASTKVVASDAAENKAVKAAEKKSPKKAE